MRGVTTVITALSWLLLTMACGDTPPQETGPTPVAPPAIGTLSGTVTSDAGAPLNAVVSIVDGRGRLTTTDTAGAYRFENIEAGLTTVRSWSKAYQTVEARVVVSGATSLNLVLPPLPKGTLSGRITDADNGAGIPAATVLILSDLTTEVVADWGRRTTTDADGRYAFENFTLGNANVAATAPGYVERRAGQNIGVNSTLDFALRRIAAPEVFTGAVGWVPPPPCVVTVPWPKGGTVDYPCIAYPFTMRRSGSIEVAVTWRGGTQNTLQVQVLGPLGAPIGNPQPVRTSDGTVHRLAFTQSIFTTGNLSLRIVDDDNYRFAGSPTRSTATIPFTLTLTRLD